MSNTIALTNTDNVVKAIRYAVKTRGYWETFVAENNITHETKIADVARALAVLAYPTDEPVQKIDGKRTRFGNAVQAAGNGIRSVLGKGESEEEPTVALITRAGAKATREEVIAAWEAAQK